MIFTLGIIGTCLEEEEDVVNGLLILRDDSLLGVEQTYNHKIAFHTHITF